MAEIRRGNHRRTARAMTATQRRECLWVIGWPQRLLARRMGWSEGSVRQWFRGGANAPPELDAWLERRAAAMLADPPPKRPETA